MWPFAGLLMVLFFLSSLHTPLHWLMKRFPFLELVHIETLLSDSQFIPSRSHSIQSIFINIIDRVTKVTIWFLLTARRDRTVINRTETRASSKSGYIRNGHDQVCNCSVRFSWKNWTECGTKTKTQEAKKKNKQKKNAKIYHWLKWNVNKALLWCNTIQLHFNLVMTVHVSVLA